ncbi:MAG: MBL fold metallo-hydrolase [Candidatus Paceibacterota bacterium]
MFETFFTKENKNKTMTMILAFIAFIILFFSYFNKDSISIYFFNVGQGDSQLIDIRENKNNIQFLIDGGPLNSNALHEMNNVLGLTDKYIDIIFLSHSQLDHFGGLIDIIKTYKIGLFVYNGVNTKNPSFLELANILNENQIKVLKVSKGDKVKYKDFIIEILHPTKNSLLVDDINESSLVLKFTYKSINTLFTGDIGSITENKIINENISSEILKVPHHGSRYSSSINFLNSVKPIISVIQVGKNSYGHPTEDTLNNLDSIGSQVFRNDLDGTIRIDLTSDKINIYKNENLK